MNSNAGTTPPVTLLAADIGGTRARFALFDAAHGGLALLARAELPTAQAKDFRALVSGALEHLAASAPGDIRPVAAALAVAGPVRGGRFCLPPNIPYGMDLDTLPNGLLPVASVLVNDFAAQAHGCRQFGAQRSQRVLEGVFDEALVQGVVGPGTGLGQAALLPDGRGGVLVGGSEGGHAAFPFASGEEQRFQDFVLRVSGEPFARWETVVSGPGLALVHHYLTGQEATPADVANSIGPQSATSEWFARFLGRACRDYVLQVVAWGGVYVSGGVAARNPAFLAHPAFAAEFRASHTHPDIMANVGVRLVSDVDVGLWGAAALAQGLARG